MAQDNRQIHSQPTVEKVHTRQMIVLQQDFKSLFCSIWSFFFLLFVSAAGSCVTWFFFFLRCMWTLFPFSCGCRMTLSDYHVKYQQTYIMTATSMTHHLMIFFHFEPWPHGSHWYSMSCVLWLWEEMFTEGQIAASFVIAQGISEYHWTLEALIERSVGVMQLNIHALISLSLHYSVYTLPAVELMQQICET